MNPENQLVDIPLFSKIHIWIVSRICLQINVYHLWEQKNINDKAMKFEHGTTLNEQLINAIITTKNGTWIFEISDIINSFPPPVEGEVGPMGIRESGNKRKKII